MAKKKSHEDFIADFARLQPELFSKCIINDSYTNVRTKLSITCKVCGSEGKRKASSLLVGHDCKQCTILNSRTTPDKFFAKLFALYPDYQRKYDYSETVIDGAKCKLTFTCNDCGLRTTQHRLDYHFSGRSCAGCAERFPFTREDLVRESTAKYGDRFDFSITEDFTGKQTPIKIICDRHGEIETTADKHLRHKLGCRQCSLYDLDEVKRMFSTNPFTVGQSLPFIDEELYKPADKEGRRYITISCPEHRLSQIRSDAFLSGSGCPDCGHARSGGTDGIYNITLAQRHKEDYMKEETGLYLLRLKSDQISCYKLGISKHLNKRTNKIRSRTGADIEVLFYEKLDKYNAIMEEQTLLQNRGDLEYHSPVKFEGCKELLTLTDEQASDLIEYLDGMVRRVKQT